MAKKHRVSTLMDSHHVKVGKRLLRSPRQFFCHIFWSLWENISSKKSFLVVSEILRLFLTYWHPMTSILSHLKPMFNATKAYAIISKSKNVLWLSFLHFRKLNKIWITMKKKMSLGVYFFLKLLTAKSGVTSMPNEPRIGTLMERQHVKGSETLLKSGRKYLSHIFWLLWKKNQLEKLCFSIIWNLETAC